MPPSGRDQWLLRIFNHIGKLSGFRRDFSHNMKHLRYPVAKPYITAEDKKGVRKVLDSGMLSLGPKYTEFENSLARYVGAKHACAVSNGTCGLHLAVRALGLKDGDEVITSPFSFVSSSNVLLYEHVKPVFIDIEETTFNMDPQYLSRALTKKTKAILVVHIFGQSPEMDAIRAFARKHRLKIIEDACESLGSSYKKKMTGILGDVGVYAFYPNKQMTTGEGGMIVTNSSEIAALCKSMRNQGRNSQGDWLVHERLGYNYRIDEMSAALGVSQLAKLDWMIQRKRQIAEWYSEVLSSHPAIMTPMIGAHRTHSWFVYVIRITNGKRNTVMDRLDARGIQTKPYLPVIHLQPFMKKMFHYKHGDFPIAERVSSQTLALPFYIGLTKKDINIICSELMNVL